MQIRHRPSLAQVRGLHQYIPLFEAIVPASWRRTVAELIPAPPLKRIMHIVDTLGTRSTEIFQAKKKALLAGDEALKEQVGEGKDLISVLCALFSCPMWGPGMLTVVCWGHSESEHGRI